MMKLAALAAVLLSLAVLPASAQTVPPPAPVPAGPLMADFAQHKQMHLTRIGKHIAILQQEQACVQVAANPPAMRACTQARNAAMQALRQEFRARN